MCSARFPRYLMSAWIAGSSPAMTKSTAQRHPRLNNHNPQDRSVHTSSPSCLTRSSILMTSDDSASDRHAIIFLPPLMVMSGNDKKFGVPALLPLALRRRDARLVEALRMHDINFAHQNVGRDLVFGAAELAEGRQQSEVIEGFDRQRQAQRPRFRAVFRSRHRSNALFNALGGVGFWTYNQII